MRVYVFCIIVIMILTSLVVTRLHTIFEIIHNKKTKLQIVAFCLGLWLSDALSNGYAIMKG